jgi:uncharacterized protein (TIGR00255 family)
MIKSMTAYAAAENSTNELKVSTEIRAYNSRYLDIALRVPSGYITLEDKLKKLISARVIRGRLEVKIQIESDSEEANVFEIDRLRAQSFHSVLNQLRDAFDIKSEISLELLLSPGGIIKPVEAVKDTDAAWPAVEDCINQALEQLDVMRKREGDFIARDLSKRLERIEKRLDQIKNKSSGLLDVYQQQLKERILVLTQNMVDIDPARIAQEAAIIADKSDISEETVRAGSHLQQFRHLMQTDESAGRKLNFLLQELHREFNTMGSKVGNDKASHIIIEVKSELEKIREQIQNVE